MILKIIATGQMGTPAELFPQISFSGGIPSAEWMLTNGVEDAYPAILATPWPPFDPMTQKAQALASAMVNGVLSQQWEIVALDAATIAAKQAEAKAQSISGIEAALAALDLKRIRPLAEGDSAYLAGLNEQALALRAKLV